ncbi:MAG: choice-of-anchor D domain-containing protein [Pseudomonadota bacterium]|nr:choice-of-anchor D domain-containing protein [Pseudomonadota bacterium]
MHGIFISYRREDAAGYAGRLYDRLAAHFGDERVFMDVEGIEPGADFFDAIERAVGSCEALIVIIGNEWLAVDSAGHRRLDDPADFVRLETATALARGIRVVPVLVEGAVMPRADQLPPDLAPLTRRQAVELSHKQWDATTAELIRTLEKILDKGKARIVKIATAEPKPQAEPQRSEPQPLAGDRRFDRRYWGIGAVLLLGIASVLLYLTQPWRKDTKPAPTLTVLRVTPAQVEFGEQPLRIAGPTAVVTLANGGGAPLRVRSVKIEGSNAAEFTLGESQCNERKLDPGESCSIKVTFSPQASGTRVATLAIAAEGTSTAAAVSMQGRGAEPVTAVVTPPLDQPKPPPAGRPTLPPERKPEVATAPPKILNFESRVERDKLWLCYGVENAASATITPQPGAVKPSAKECVSVAADVGKTYTLSARNAAGEVVSRTLTVAARASPPTVAITVPDLVGKSRRDAIADLEKAGLDVRVIEDKPDSSASAAVDSVVSQLPKGGEQLKAGGRVTLHIAAAPSSATPAPAPAPAPAAALATVFPRVGDTWHYRVRSIWKNVEERTFVHQVTAVSEREVRETMGEVASGDNASESKSFGPDPRFVEWRGKGYYFVEFNPFLQAFGALQLDTAWKSLTVPVENPFYTNWYSQGRVIGWESISVPAGSFKALRVELNSSRAARASSTPEPQRVRYVIWYASDAKRTIKHVRTVYAANGSKLDEQTYELVKYRVQ